MRNSSGPLCCCFRQSPASIGMFLGAAEGIMCRNAQRAAICAAVGLGVGFAGGLVSVFSPASCS